MEKNLNLSAEYYQESGAGILDSKKIYSAQYIELVISKTNTYGTGNLQNINKFQTS